MLADWLIYAYYTIFLAKNQVKTAKYLQDFPLCIGDVRCFGRRYTFFCGFGGLVVFVWPGFAIYETSDG